MFIINLHFAFIETAALYANTRNFWDSFGSSIGTRNFISCTHIVQNELIKFSNIFTFEVDEHYALYNCISLTATANVLANVCNETTA